MGRSSQQSPARTNPLGAKASPGAGRDPRSALLPPPSRGREREGKGNSPCDCASALSCLPAAHPFRQNFWLEEINFGSFVVPRWNAALWPGVNDLAPACRSRPTRRTPPLVNSNGGKPCRIAEIICGARIVQTLMGLRRMGGLFASLPEVGGRLWLLRCLS